MDADQTVPVRNVDRVDVLEERQGLDREDDDDPDRRHDPEGRRDEQQRLDDPFGPRSPPGQIDSSCGSLFAHVLAFVVGAA